MRIKDALGLGPADGRLVVPVRTWLPLLVVGVVLAAAMLGVLDEENSLTTFAVITVPLALVMPIAALITIRAARRRR